jgi:hypothetical protein
MSPLLFLSPASQGTVLWSVRLVRDVAARVGRARAEVSGDGAAGVVLDVDEDDTRAVHDELRHRRLANPAGGAGDQSDFPNQPAAIPRARRKLRSIFNFCRNITFTCIERESEREANLWAFKDVEK